jgi:large-conductance mechanosensitive channel
MVSPNGFKLFNSRDYQKFLSFSYLLNRLFSFFLLHHFIFIYSNKINNSTFKKNNLKFNSASKQSKQENEQLIPLDTYLGHTKSTESC